jgi:hypothetical protein
MKDYTVGKEEVYDLRHKCLFETYSEQFVSFRDIIEIRAHKSPLESPAGATVK